MHRDDRRAWHDARLSVGDGAGDASRGYALRVPRHRVADQRRRYHDPDRDRRDDSRFVLTIHRTLLQLISCWAGCDLTAVVVTPKERKGRRTTCPTASYPNCRITTRALGARRLLLTKFFGL